MFPLSHISHPPPLSTYIPNLLPPNQVFSFCPILFNSLHVLLFLVMCVAHFLSSFPTPFFFQKNLNKCSCYSTYNSEEHGVAQHKTQAISNIGTYYMSICGHRSQPSAGGIYLWVVWYVSLAQVPNGVQLFPVGAWLTWVPNRVHI